MFSLFSSSFLLFVLQIITLNKKQSKKENKNVDKCDMSEVWSAIDLFKIMIYNKL